MVWLVALVLALGILAAWLSGHWFARVVVFLALGGLCVALYAVTIPAAAPWFLILGLPASWAIAYAPSWFYRWRAKASREAAWYPAAGPSAPPGRLRLP